MQGGLAFLKYFVYKRYRYVLLAGIHKTHVFTSLSNREIVLW